MRSSDDLDPLLERFRPVGPPPDPRARVMKSAHGARGFSRAAEWLPAAAALLLVVLFHWLATTERQLLESRITPIPPVDEPAITLREPPG